MSSSNTPENTEERRVSNFVRNIIEEDIASGKNGGQVVTRFPPEPNGYLHIGHAKSICLNFGLAERYSGQCHLRFDDTNPSKEEDEYVHAIKEDVRWLGFDWGEHEHYASDYFDQIYDWAIKLIEEGKAYVCDLTFEEMKEYRGSLTEPGKNSPCRDRSAKENLDLFARMAAGEFEEGTKVLRAKIDMAAPNLNLRDPVMYRILKAEHHRTGSKWNIYPMYDFTHGQSDSLEGITHSICTLEFEDHRPLYDWYINALGIHHPQQIEFARLNIGFTMMSKRNLLTLVDDGHVEGWDDPRMTTLSGMRRRGYPPKAIRDFCEAVGVAKANSTVDFAWLEHFVRDELNKTVPRFMAVVNPLKVVIENYPVDQVDELDAVNNPEDPSAGTRKVPFSKVIYIEREDFMEDPPKKFFRLAPGREVRLRYAYFVTCTDVIKDEAGEIAELRCTYDPETRGGNAPDGRRVKATLHWVSEAHAATAEVRNYNQLFTKENPNRGKKGKHWTTNINPDSLEVRAGCLVEPALADVKAGERVQFERLGYYCADSKDHTRSNPVFNRTATLKDAWAKAQKKG
jgi:glutaminyl-tRNA synthetase